MQMDCLVHKTIENIDFHLKTLIKTLFSNVYACGTLEMFHNVVNNTIRNASMFLGGEMMFQDVYSMFFSFFNVSNALSPSKPSFSPTPAPSKCMKCISNDSQQQPHFTQDIFIRNRKE
jgi:hypothetical protein